MVALHFKRCYSMYNKTRVVAHLDGLLLDRFTKSSKPQLQQGFERDQNNGKEIKK